MMQELSHPTGQPVWRAAGVYLPTSASKTGLVEETRLFLLSLDRLQAIGAARQALVDGALPQRSRETRETIVGIIQQRFIRWSPPGWVYRDLIAFAQDTDQPSLQAALLLHVVRQDVLLYDFVQQNVTLRWQRGDHTLIRADVQRFLDQALPEHPEIDGWSRVTREKLAGNILSILRDYGLLRGREQKQIVEPLVPTVLVDHLIRLLREEGVDADALADHPDWRIWLWTSQRACQALKVAASQETSA
jgi:BrxA